MNEFDLRKYLYSNPLMEKKEDSKKGNKEEQKRMEGAIRDNRDHKFDIDKDEDEQRKKLAKLKKDAKKETGKGKKGNEDEQKRAEGAIKDAKDHKKALDKDIKADEKKLKKLKKDFKKDVKEGMYSDDDRDDIPGTPEFETEYNVDPRNNRMMTREGLKDMIREKITSILNEDAELYEAEEEEIEKNTDVEVKDDTTVKADIEKEVDVDDESVESDVEVKTSVPGADKDTSEVLGLLTKASEASDAFSDDPELKTQIGNTITYFTRKHVAKV